MEKYLFEIVNINHSPNVPETIDFCSLAGLSRTEIVNEMLGFMIAGFDTTSATLAWSIYLLSKHSRAQQKIKEELIAHDAKYDLSLDRLDSLTYLDCFINEVLRFTLPANGTVRTLTADDRLPESEFLVCSGDTVYIPFYNLSRDTRYWKIDPELFYPERFLDKDRDYVPYTFLPFGSGHRQCIAQDLVRFELKLIIARLMQYVTIDDGGSEVNAGGLLTKMIAAPKHVGVTIIFD